MGYTTINELPEKLVDDLVVTDYLLLTDPTKSYKVTLDSINKLLIDVSAGAYQEMTNKVIDDVTNFVHANGIHYAATAIQDIPKGSPVKLVEDVVNDLVYVDIATSNDDSVIGICEDGLLSGEQGEIMVTGIFTGTDTSAYTEGTLLYYQEGSITDAPNDFLSSQPIGYVLNVSATEGKILIANPSTSFIASSISYANSTSGLAAVNVQDAIDEVAARKIVTTGKLPIETGSYADLPSKAIGGIIGDSAWVYEDPLDNHFTEYSCSIAQSGERVEFVGNDQLDGKFCVVTYLSAV
jgi:hypothetical protein